MVKIRDISIQTMEQGSQTLLAGVLQTGSRYIYLLRIKCEERILRKKQ
jgi:hypothetical protein